MVILAPALASPSLIALPIPLFPPVTIATLPFSDMASLSWLSPDSSRAGWSAFGPLAPHYHSITVRAARSPIGRSGCARSWRPIAARSRACISALTRASPIPGLRIPRRRWDQIRHSVAGQPPLAGTHRLSSQAPCWPSAERSATILRELHLSGRKLDEAAPRDRQGGVASGRTLPASRLHRHQHGEAGRECRRVL